MRIRKKFHWPADKELRWEQRFAWLPQAVENEVVWLNFYWVRLQYVQFYGDQRNTGHGYWSEYIKQDVDF
jgi:hypothetical protein